MRAKQQEQTPVKIGDIVWHYTYSDSHYSLDESEETKTFGFITGIEDNIVHIVTFKNQQEVLFITTQHKFWDKA
jgi:hypothetical protein